MLELQGCHGYQFYICILHKKRLGVLVIFEDVLKPISPFPAPFYTHSNFLKDIDNF